MRKGYVYFIRPVGEDGPIKIGFSSFVDVRLDELMRWSPLPLEVIAFGEGNQRLERAIHAMFKDRLAHKEWFIPNAKMRSCIANVSLGIPVADAFGLEMRIGRSRFNSPARIKYREIVPS